MQDAQHLERVITLVESTLLQPPEMRDDYLRLACQGDQELFTEVTESISWRQRMGSFLLEPLITFGGYDAPFEAGELISERFRIIRQIGAGGMGVVYEAFDTKRNQTIAVKAA